MKYTNDFKQEILDELFDWKRKNQKKFMCRKDYENILEKFQITKQLFSRLHKQEKFDFIVGYLFDEITERTSTKAKILLVCDVCKKEYVTRFAKIKQRKFSKSKLCNDHYLKFVTNTQDWKEKNSAAQKIAQNKPTTLEKQKKSQIKRHAVPGMKEKYSEIAKKMWCNEEYRQKVTNANKEKWKDTRYAERVFSKCHSRTTKENYCSSYQGYYENIRYQSLSELCFILWAFKKNLFIKRYDLKSISWFDDNNKEHAYYPDFIVNENEIVEIKSSKCKSLYDTQNVQKKFNSLTKFCENTKYICKLIYSNELDDYKNLRTEAKIIYENYK